ncbi:hypothetical protein CCACVL1_24083 [Corchorus capsularis]|uniref:Uncharacterized protein n=1 Tax=Corchorus capsularis TaxID=210143 RepID=A0A1R3GR33_COCAP|nr:hypothetical protein CCACVL1_24083 [Corchorus capsularis]
MAGAESTCSNCKKARSQAASAVRTYFKINESES